MRAVAAVAAVLAAAAFGACGSGDGGGAPSDSALAEVAPFVGDGPAGVDFVDWAAVKEQLGASELSSKSSSKQKSEFLDRRLRRASDIAPLYSRNVLTGARLVGFDVADLDWEASVQSAAAPVSVLGFPDDFDFAPVEEALERCGYRRSEVEGGTLYSKDPVAACGGEKDEFGTRTPEPRLASVAVLPDDHAAVAAASPGAVKAVVEARGSGEGFESRVDDLGGTLEGVVAGYVGYGKFGCKQFSPAGLPPGRLTPEIEEALKQQTGDLGPAYDVLLVGFVGDDSRFTGRVALDYEEEGEAKDGLEPRRSAFEKQSAPSIAEPLSALLRLTSAKAEDDALVFALAPRGGGPLTLNAPLTHRDLLFASC